MYLLNAWYVAMWADDLGTGVLEPRKLLDLPIVFFRREDGGPAAMLDICPHRFAAFSVLGHLLPGDRVQCPYHGLEFNAEGECVHNPHRPGNLPSAATVRIFPVVEQDSILWIWMGDPAKADPATIARFPLLVESSPSHISKRDHLTLDASYILITENLLDLSHASILHDGILGNEHSIDADIAVEQQGGTLSVTRLTPNVPVPGMYDLMYRRDGGMVDMWTTMTWQAPGCMVNDTGVTEVGGAKEDGTGIYGHHFLTPVTPTETLYHFCAVRQNPPVLDPSVEVDVREQISALRRMAFSEQDGRVIAAQQARVLNPAVDTSRPVLLKIDEAPVRYRRMLDQLMTAERS
ncbi:aromatic ring-hydroxylating dioxygenase subunit alpha [Sphingobium sp.]|uniref:aromatic ring-hydroxylating dioxygenase subunit alpha n=1 Tax=Sphingobium sp. TaxID=1912891 RepID=UPI0028BD1BA8|nr:aromatic ring-hydroxylating dioxygenase subunit alpha [Sphingobium sp.]